MHWVNLAHPEAASPAIFELYENLKLLVVQNQHIMRMLEVVLANQEKTFKELRELRVLIQGSDGGSMSDVSTEDLEEGERRKRKSASLDVNE